MQILATCHESSNATTAQGLAIALSVVFSVYVFVDTVLAAFVISRRCKSSE